jgi:hypothetical protein
MEGSVLSFLKAEWKVSNTGSTQAQLSAEPLVFISSICVKNELYSTKHNFQYREVTREWTIQKHRQDWAQNTEWKQTKQKIKNNNREI